MGRDKALLPFGGQATLAEYQIRRLSPLFNSIYISAKADKFPFDVPLIEDISLDEEYAPIFGLLSVLTKLESDFFALSVDAPFVDEKVFGKLFDLYCSEKADLFIVRSPSGSHPMCGIYTQRMVSPLKKAIEAGEHKLNRLLAQVETRYVDFDDETLFYNMNRPAEYEKALKMIAGGREQKTENRE